MISRGTFLRLIGCRRSERDAAAAPFWWSDRLSSLLWPQTRRSSLWRAYLASWYLISERLCQMGRRRGSAEIQRYKALVSLVISRSSFFGSFAVVVPRATLLLLRVVGLVMLWSCGGGRLHGAICWIARGRQSRSDIPLIQEFLVSLDSRPASVFRRVDPQIVSLAVPATTNECAAQLVVPDWRTKVKRYFSDTRVSCLSGLHLHVRPASTS